jgi:DNA-binding NarL/FixJ family response regulator
LRRRISLVLFDDAGASVNGVVNLIRAEPGFHVIAVAAKVEVALAKIQETKPNIVLLNLRAEGDDCLTLAGALHGQTPASRVILMGVEPLEADLAGFVRAGVSGFIMADASFAEFLVTVHSVAGGVQVLPTALTRSLFGQLSGWGRQGPPKRRLDIRRLTSRERAVTDLIVRGASNKEIAAHLQIALNTVKSHVRKVLSKLSVNSRLEVAAFSRPAGLKPASHPFPANPVPWTDSLPSSPFDIGGILTPPN